MNIDCSVQLTFYFQLIELWETFLLQLDVGDEGNPLFSPQAPSNESAAETAASAETTTANEGA